MSVLGDAVPFRFDTTQSAQPVEERSAVVPLWRGQRQLADYLTFHGTAGAGAISFEKAAGLEVKRHDYRNALAHNADEQTLTLRASATTYGSYLRGTSLVPLEADQVEMIDPSAHVVKVRDERLALLARKYADTTVSAEDRSRIEILTARLRNLVPRVTPEALAAMEADRSEALAGQAAMEELQRRFGLR